MRHVRLTDEGHLKSGEAVLTAHQLTGLAYGLNPAEADDLQQAAYTRLLSQPAPRKLTRAEMHTRAKWAMLDELTYLNRRDRLNCELTEALEDILTDNTDSRLSNPEDAFIRREETEARERALYDQLLPVECCILNCMRRGQRKATIAKRLGFTLRTLNRYCAHIYAVALTLGG
jgi:DNA-directed RNA polymerase specialized sigma24 family protein